ncbi:hypothetical protein [Lentzea cavernae]|uniref:hypothetical protein n=1 Tax=Lentzea cavernae TaxID=2020703 RepID=UPI001E410CDC|nr:hypothetical protein [Lentzea cavernae]
MAADGVDRRGTAGRRHGLGGDLVDSLITRPGGLVAVLETVSQCSQLIPPGALGNAEPVEVPVSGHNLVLTLINRSDLEVHLDNVRPLIVEALLPDGERASGAAPLTVGARRAETVVLCPVTSRQACVAWRLVIRWHEDGEVLHSAWDLVATGYVGWTTTAPDGEAVPRPLNQLGHWDPMSTWQDGGTSYDEHLAMIVTPDQAWLDAIRYD